MKVCWLSSHLFFSYRIPFIVVGWVSIIIQGFHDGHRWLPSLHRRRSLRPATRMDYWSSGTKLQSFVGDSANTTSSRLSSHEINEPDVVKNINHDLDQPSEGRCDGVMFRREHRVPSNIHVNMESSRSLNRFITNEKDWMEAEIAFYRNSHRTYVPWITHNTEEKGKVVPLKHLEAAAKEFARRFPYRSLEQEEEEQREMEMASGSPALLVANHVDEDWHVPCKFQNEHAVRFMLVPGESTDTSTLFIKCMAGPKHSFFHKWIVVDIDDWVRDNGLRDFICGYTAGGKGYEPDEAYGPMLPDWCNPDGDKDCRLQGDPYARLVIEVEYTHRDALAVRHDGFTALNNPYTRMFLAIKIWAKGVGGNFGAVAILWGKNDDNIISFRKAVDFGTKQLEWRSKELFELPWDANNLLPPVTEWTRPQPRPGYDSLRSEIESFDTSTQIEGLLPDDDYHLTLPVEDLLFKTSTKHSTKDRPYILGDGIAIPDCKINLQKYLWNINRKDF